MLNFINKLKKSYRFYYKINWFFIFIFIISCSREQKQSSIHNFTPKIIEAKSNIISNDSLPKPKIIPINENKLRKISVGNPHSIPTNTNIHLSNEPNLIIAKTPKICTSGTDTFLIAKTSNIIDSPFVAGNPEIIIAKDAYIKDQNPQNFSSFNKLQGLKHDVTRCILKDKMGNLWLGTLGGVCKYDGKSFTHFTENEGLSNNSVLSVVEDKKGNIWFGTLGGITKFDGKYFTQITENEGLSLNSVLSIYCDKKGNIWVGTDGGGVDKITDKTITHYTEKEGLSNNYVYSIFEDKKGNMWFGTDAGVCKFDGKSFYTYTENEGLSNNSVLSIFEDKNNNFWFGTGNGVSKFDGKTFCNYTENEGLCNNVVWSIIEDNNKNIWFGTEGGVCKFDGDFFTHYTEKEGLCNNNVCAILQETNGNFWIGTNGGVSKYDGKCFTHYTTKEGLSNNRIFSIVQDKNDNFWFGTSDGGVCKYDGKTFSHITENEGLINNSVYSVLEDKKGNIWFGTSRGTCKFDGKYFTYFTENEGLIQNSVWSIFEDKTGNIWFGTEGGVCKYDGKSFTQFTENEGLCNNTVISIIQDFTGNMWFGTSGGVCKFDGKSFTHFTEKEGLSNNSVWSIIQDKKGNFWFGTLGGGVCKYDGKTFTHFTEKEGLNNNYVFSILEDKRGNIWFGTRFGLSKLDKNYQQKLNSNLENNQIKNKDVLFKSFTYEDGFLGIGCNRGAFYEDKSGTIWIGANDRLTAYHPEGDEEDTIPPNIQITSIELSNENIEWVNLENKKDTTIILGNGIKFSDFKFEGLTRWFNLPKNLSLAHYNNYLTFNFIGITQKQNKKVKYQFKLDGIDENWSAITNKTEAPYGNLPHGDYVFRVKAMNSEGFWSQEYDYEFTIRPPWWKTWWFRTLGIIAIIASVVFYIKWRERELKERQKVLEHTVEERTAEVVQQKHIIEEKHKEITDSINYAERIQRSFLATKNLLDENLKDYFVFFHPKDVVSGDFYWATKLKNNNFLLLTADSTGHGVPGAIMSILNISSLEKAVEFGLIETAEILNHTRKTIIERLKKDGSPEGGKDGMDASLISFDFENQKIMYSAANNPVWIVRKNEKHENEHNLAHLIELAPDKMQVGKHDKDQISFTQHEFHLKKGDVIYTLSDGFSDQFGGEKGKKFLSKNLKHLLVSISQKPMNEQKMELEKALNNWKGNNEQVDDITIMGIKV